MSETLSKLEYNLGITRGEVPDSFGGVFGHVDVANSDSEIEHLVGTGVTMTASISASKSDDELPRYMTRGSAAGPDEEEKLIRQNTLGRAGKYAVAKWLGIFLPFKHLDTKDHDLWTPSRRPIEVKLVGKKSLHESHGGRAPLWIEIDDKLGDDEIAVLVNPLDNEYRKFRIRGWAKGGELRKMGEVGSVFKGKDEPDRYYLHAEALHDPTVLEGLVQTGMY